MGCIDGRLERLRFRRWPWEEVVGSPGESGGTEGVDDEPVGEVAAGEVVFDDVAVGCEVMSQEEGDVADQRGVGDERPGESKCDEECEADCENCGKNRFEVVQHRSICRVSGSQHLPVTMEEGERCGKSFLDVAVIGR